MLESQKQEGGFSAALCSTSFLDTCHGAAALTLLGHATFHPLPARGLRWLPWGSVCCSLLTEFSDSLEYAVTDTGNFSYVTVVTPLKPRLCSLTS